MGVTDHVRPNGVLMVHGGLADVVVGEAIQQPRANKQGTQQLAMG